MTDILGDRGVAQVAALGYLGDEGTGGFNRWGPRSDLLCQGTPVGSKASQSVPPSGASRIRVPKLELGNEISEGRSKLGIQSQSTHTSRIFSNLR